MRHPIHGLGYARLNDANDNVRGFPRKKFQPLLSVGPDHSRAGGNETDCGRDGSLGAADDNQCRRRNAEKHQQRQAVGSEKRSQLEPLVVKSENRTEQVPRKAGKDEAAYPFQNYPKRGESQPAGIGVFEIPANAAGMPANRPKKAPAASSVSG